MRRIVRTAAVIAGCLAMAFGAGRAFAAPPVGGALATAETPTAKKITVPANVGKYEDDSLCTLFWNDWPKSLPGSAGYEVRWGKVGGEYKKSAMTPYNAYQCQPLEKGVTYQAQIRALDQWGRASAWSPPIPFKENTARVDAMRRQCSVTGGFFEDFNENGPKTPNVMGKYDAKKWNFAVGRFTDEDLNGFFVNYQKHAHFTLISKRWDRSQVVARPRSAVLDISDGKTRTIYIDMDSHPDGRNIWYLDFVPEDSPVRDITARDSVDLSDGRPVDVANMLRFTQSNSRISCQVANEKAVLKAYPGKLLDQFSKTPNPPMINVRRPWKFTVSRSLVEAYLFDWKSGEYQKALSQPVDLKWKRARLFNTLFGYNGPKNGQARWLWHFDNFAFDAPANARPAPIVYDYATEKRYGKEFGSNFMVRVPDNVFTAPVSGPPASPLMGGRGAGNKPVSGGWSHRLYYTVATKTVGFAPFRNPAGNFVRVNGRSFPLNLPDDRQRSHAIDLPPGLLKKGDNVIAFSWNPPSQAGAMNVHIEAIHAAPQVSKPEHNPQNARKGARMILVGGRKASDRKAGSVPPPLPPYSTHCAIWGCAEMKMPEIKAGPDVIIGAIGSHQTWNWGNPAKSWPDKVPMGPIAGKVPVTIVMSQFVGITANGQSAPARRLELVVDGKTAATMDLSGGASGGAGAALRGRYTFQMDAARLTDGRHEVYARAVTPNGWESVPNYFEQGDKAGKYHPIVINVQNR